MKSSNLNVKWLNEDVARSKFLSPLNNILFWLIYFTIDYLSSLLIDPSEVNIIPALFNFAFVLMFFYGILFFVLPNSIPLKNNLATIFKFIIFLLIVINLKWHLSLYIFELDSPFSKFFVIEVIRGFHFTILASLVCFILISFKKLKEKYNILLQARQAELTQYQIIINPHFIANGLNVINADFITGNKNVNESLEEFTEILSYCFSNTSKRKISLFKEILCIQKLIAFQKKRYSERFYVDFTILDPYEIANKLKIPKMTLLTLIENVFKHAEIHDPENPALINIKIIKVNGIPELNLHINNKILSPEHIRFSSKSGIQAVEYILQCYYPNRHLLNYAIAGNNFRLSLQINYGQKV
ncbi:histidine kinase [Belliella aquatica]|uniref:histidine kinase n=1 Tax=Belliella aquatica TaxID=1323734 RepID=UPI00166E3D60|nr:sensor histidine kinase [Belliella aquatica]MCH7407651.1 histidine kinase [Belliella aquatica]